MAKGARNQRKTGTKPSPSVVKNISDAKKHKVVFALIIVLMGLILIANGIKTEASQTVSDISIEVARDGANLRASASRSDEASAWQIIRLEDRSCNIDAFANRSEYGQEPIFRLTAEDNGYYYCLRAEDQEGAYAYQSSERIDLSDLYQTPEIIIEQFDNILLAETSLNDARKYAFRAVRVENSECDQQTFESLQDEIIKDNAIVLKPDDVSKRYCFEAEHRLGFKDYQISTSIDSFEEIENTAEQSLQIVKVEQFDDIVIVQANKAAHWLSASVSGGDYCSEEPFGYNFGIQKSSEIAYAHLYTDDNSRQYCFQAYDADLKDSNPIHILSSSITDVSQTRSAVGYNALSSQDYLFEVSESYPTDEDLRSLLEPLLNETGRGILDNLEIVIASEIDCPDEAFGCYWVNLGYYLEESHNKIYIKAIGFNHYEGLDFYARAEINHQLIQTFIREFMHATDLGDDDPVSDMYLKYKANLCQDSILEDLREEDEDLEVADNLPLDSISQLERTDPAFEKYLSCLDRSDPLFGVLRDAYDNLPADILLDGGRWLSRDVNTDIDQISEDFEDYLTRDEPRWYTELYARLISIEELSEELENHYGLYFSDRQAIVDIFEFNQ